MWIVRLALRLIVLGCLAQTLNLMTLGGLSLAVGILVDDATVEIENVHRNLAMRKPIVQAILDGAQQIAVPAFVATLCICIVFIPVVFISGAARSLFTPLGMAVVFDWALDHKRIVTGAFAVFVVMSLASLFPRLGRDFFPSVDAGQIRFHVRTNPGTRIETTEQLFERVEDEIHAVIPREEIVSDSVDKLMAAARKDLPRGTSMVVRGQVESMNASFRGLSYGIVAAVALVYFLMVINFQSWLDPAIILSALPGALAGIVWMLFATGTTLSVPALMGAIMSIGVATSNSILMVTFANDQRKVGMDERAAAWSAGITRLRPVMMTALAMILGMLPMSLGLGDGGEQNAPLGRAVIGGLMVATLTTLFFVPVVYSAWRKRPPPFDRTGRSNAMTSARISQPVVGPETHGEGETFDPAPFRPTRKGLAWSAGVAAALFGCLVTAGVVPRASSIRDGLRGARDAGDTGARHRGARRAIGRGLECRAAGLRGAPPRSTRSASSSTCRSSMRTPSRWGWTRPRPFAKDPGARSPARWRGRRTSSTWARARSSPKSTSRTRTTPSWQACTVRSRFT
jgi:multidrug efflux pump subunit AcrB